MSKRASEREGDVVVTSSQQKEWRMSRKCIL